MERRRLNDGLAEIRRRAGRQRACGRGSSEEMSMRDHIAALAAASLLATICVVPAQAALTQVNVRITVERDSGLPTRVRP